MRKLILITVLLLLAAPAQAGVVRLRAYLVVAPASAVAVRDRLVSLIDQTPVDCAPGEPSRAPRILSNMDGHVAIVFDVCFRDGSVVRRWKDALISAWTSGTFSSVILRRSRARFHVCRHEDAEGECTRPINLLERLEK